MALSFGLNVKSKAQDTRGGQQRPLKSLLDDDDEYEDLNPSSAKDGRPAEETIEEFDRNQETLAGPALAAPKSSTQLKQPQAQPQHYADLSSTRISRKHAQTAQDLDASIYDYDAYHDAQSTVAAARKAVEKRESQDRKPKYMDKLLDAAARRKQDQLVAREKFLQREREAEGDEFADKEKFVTAAYKAQQEEARKVEEEEARKAAAEEQRRRKLGGGLQGFYKGIIEQGEKRHSEAVEVAHMLETGTLPLVPTQESRNKTDLELAAEMRKRGVEVHVNDEGQVTDKRQLLSAGLNVVSTAKKSDDLARRQQSAPRPQGFKTNDRAARERQTRMLETQLAESTKRAADEVELEQARLAQAARTTKTDADISSARARYLARKAEAEAAKK